MVGGIPLGLVAEVVAFVFGIVGREAADALLGQQFLAGAFQDQLADLLADRAVGQGGRNHHVGPYLEVLVGAVGVVCQITDIL